MTDYSNNIGIIGGGIAGLTLGCALLKKDIPAVIFEKMGGEVIYFGKPYPEIYNFFVKKNEKILAIGDNIKTDIVGANRMKFDSLFITGGIHKKEFLNIPVENYDKVYNILFNLNRKDLTL